MIYWGLAYFTEISINVDIKHISVRGLPVNKLLDIKFYQQSNTMWNTEVNENVEEPFWLSCMSRVKMLCDIKQEAAIPLGPDKIWMSLVTMLLTQRWCEHCKYNRSFNVGLIDSTNENDFVLF